MAISPGTHTVGPDGSTLIVKTYREGLAAKAGHDLVIEVTSWEATINELTEACLPVPRTAGTLKVARATRRQNCVIVG